MTGPPIGRASYGSSPQKSNYGSSIVPMFLLSGVARDRLQRGILALQCLQKNGSRFLGINCAERFGVSINHRNHSGSVRSETAQMAQMFGPHQWHVDRQCEQMVRFNSGERRRQTAQRSARSRDIED